MSTADSDVRFWQRGAREGGIYWQRCPDLTGRRTFVQWKHMIFMVQFVCQSV